MPGHYEPSYASTYHPLPPGTDPNAPPRERWTVTVSQGKLLETVFETDKYPSKLLRQRLAQDIGRVSERQIQVWFQNRRQRKTADGLDAGATRDGNGFFSLSSPLGADQHAPCEGDEHQGAKVSPGKRWRCAWLPRVSSLSHPPPL